MKVAKNALNAELTNNFIECFEKEIIDDRSDLLRQGDIKREHRFTLGGLIKDGIMNLHLANKQFPASQQALIQMLTSENVRQHLLSCYGKEFDVVASMTFHANPSTSLHTDDIFLDSVPSGELVGILFALEDFTDENGNIRFFDMGKEQLDKIYDPIDEPDRHYNDFSELYDKRGEYLKALESSIDDYRPRSFKLEKNEFVSWPSYVPHETIRGTNDEYVSRMSVAAHYCPRDLDYSTRLVSNSRDLSERQEIERIAV